MKNLVLPYNNRNHAYMYFFCLSDCMIFIIANNKMIPTIISTI